MCPLLCCLVRYRGKRRRMNREPVRRFQTFKRPLLPLLLPAADKTTKLVPGASYTAITLKRQRNVQQGSRRNNSEAPGLCRGLQKCLFDQERLGHARVCLRTTILKASSRQLDRLP